MISKHTKIVGSIAGVLFLVSLAGFLGLVYMVSYSNMTLHQQKLERAKSQLHQQELASLARLVNETTDERDELSGYVLKNDEVINFLALIETLGDEQGVLFKTTALNVADKGGIFEELQVGVSISGTYASVAHVLALFETLPYQSYISSVSLSQNGRETTDAWSAIFLLHVTKYKEQ